MQRRDVLRASGAALVGASGGCLGALGEDDVPADEVEVAFEVCDCGPPLSFDTVERDAPIVVHLTSPSAATSAIDYEETTESAAATVERFVEDTDFERAMLLYVGALVRDSCRELVVESLDVTTERVLVGSAVVHDHEDEREACTPMGQPSVELVRVRAEPRLPTHAELLLTVDETEVHTLRSRPPP